MGDVHVGHRCLSDRASAERQTNYLEPWPDPVDGAEVLYEIKAQLRRYVSMPTGSPELVALWVMFTWAIDASDIAPRLFLTSPTRRCGKTTVLDILTALVHRPEANVNVTAASLYTAIDQEHCTLIPKPTSGRQNAAPSWVC